MGQFDQAINAARDRTWGYSPVTTVPEPTPSSKSPHFFERERDGSVRVRIRFTPDEASLIEEAAGTTPLLLYIHRVLGERARYHIRKRAQVEALDSAQVDNDRDDQDSV